MLRLKFTRVLAGFSGVTITSDIWTKVALSGKSLDFMIERLFDKFI